MIAVRVNKPGGGRELIQVDLVRANKKSVIVKLKPRTILPRSFWGRLWRRICMFFYEKPMQPNYIKRNIHRDLLPLQGKR